MCVLMKVLLNEEEKRKTKEIYIYNYLLKHGFKKLIFLFFFSKEDLK